jgi:Mce-associated membrane protein
MTTPDDTERPAGAPLSAAEALRRGRARSGDTTGLPGTQEPTSAAPAPSLPAAAEPAPVPLPDRPVTAASPGPAAPLLRWPLALLAAMAIAMSVLLVLGSLAVARHKATDVARRGAAQAAQRAAVDVLSADYRQLDGDIKRAESRLTPSFRKDYAQLAQKAFGQLARDNHLLLSSTVVGYGVRDASPNRVVVLVFVDQVSTTQKQPTPKLAQNRVRMTMRKIDGHWLVDKIDAL